MNVRYFADTDTLYIEFRRVPVTETRYLEENTITIWMREGRSRRSMLQGVPGFPTSPTDRWQPDEADAALFVMDVARCR